MKLLDKHRGSLKVHSGIDLVHFEVMATGQHLLRSPQLSGLVPQELVVPELPDIEQLTNLTGAEKVTLRWSQS